VKSNGAIHFLGQPNAESRCGKMKVFTDSLTNG